MIWTGIGQSFQKTKNQKKIGNGYQLQKIWSEHH